MQQLYNKNINKEIQDFTALVLQKNAEFGSMGCYIGGRIYQFPPFYPSLLQITFDKIYFLKLDMFP